MFNNNKQYTIAPATGNNENFLLNGKLTPKIYIVRKTGKYIILNNAHTDFTFLKMKIANVTVDGVKLDTLTTDAEQINAVQKLVFKKGGGSGAGTAEGGGTNGGGSLEPYIHNNNSLKIKIGTTRTIKFVVDNVETGKTKVFSSQGFTSTIGEIISVNKKTQISVTVTAPTTETAGFLWLSNNNNTTKPTVSRNVVSISAVTIAEMNINDVGQKLFTNNNVKYGNIIYAPAGNTLHTIIKDSAVNMIQDGGGDMFDNGHRHQLSTKISATSPQVTQTLINIKNELVNVSAPFKYTSKFLSNFVGTIFKIDRSSSARFVMLNWYANWGADGRGSITTRDFVIPEFKALVRVLNIWGAGDPSIALIRIFISDNSVLASTDVNTAGTYLNTAESNFNDIVDYTKDITTIFSFLFAKREQSQFGDNELTTFANTVLTDYFNG